MSGRTRCRRWAALIAAAWAAAAAPVAAQSQVRTHFYEIPHVMSCRVYLPGGYDPSRRYPLLVALHGSGGGPESFDRLWRSQAGAQCLFAVPEAPYPFPTDRRGGSSGRSWFLLVRERRVWELADPLAVRAMTATVGELAASYKTGPVYILGFSQGASLAYRTALEHPGFFAGVIAVAGVLPEEALQSSALDKARAALRVFIAHGSRDALVPLRQGETARNLLEKAGFDVTFHAFRGGHEVPGGLFRVILEWLGAAGNGPGAN